GGRTGPACAGAKRLFEPELVLRVEERLPNERDGADAGRRIATAAPCSERHLLSDGGAEPETRIVPRRGERRTDPAGKKPAIKDETNRRDATGAERFQLVGGW